MTAFGGTMRLSIGDIPRFPARSMFQRNNERNARVLCGHELDLGQRFRGVNSAWGGRISIPAWLTIVCAVWMLCIPVPTARAGSREHNGTPGINEPLQVRLGYPADAKLLIINADDLAVAHSEDVATFAALDKKLVSSATVMVPCPWFTEVAAYAKSHPQADLGLHLTLTSEWDTYRWGPVAPRALVPSLVGPDGFFYADTDSVAKHARPDEVEIE